MSKRYVSEVWHLVGPEHTQEKVGEIWTNAEGSGVFFEPLDSLILQSFVEEELWIDQNVTGEKDSRGHRVITKKFPLKFIEYLGDHFKGFYLFATAGEWREDERQLEIPYDDNK